MRILTTHSKKNPLLAALDQKGVQIDYLKFEQAKKNTDWSGVFAYYGNVFDEIKDWLGLVKLKQQLRAHGVPYVFWNRDAPWNVGIKLQNRVAMRLMKPVDIYLTHSMQGAQGFGGVAYYFPNAAQSAYSQRTDLAALRDPFVYQYDVSFFGSFGNRKDRNARERQGFLETLERLLHQAIPGIKFKAIDTSATPLTLEEQLALVRTTKINLNYGAMCDLPGNPSWGLPERVFGIPAAGGFLLTDERRSIAQTFPPGMCNTFASAEACVRTIQECLMDFGALRTKAEHLHYEVLKSHTYQQRAERLTALLQNYRLKQLA